MTKKKSAPTQEPAVMQAPTPLGGYRPKPRYRWVTMPQDLIEIEEGAEPFTAKIRSHLSFGEIEAIPWHRGARYLDLEESIVEYVVEWNVVAENVETGEMEPVPAPAVSGLDAFKFINAFELEWLAMQLKQTSLGSIESLQEAEKTGTITEEQTALKTPTRPSEPTEEPLDDEISA